MKRKPFILLVSFLMVLYIGPLILAPSSMGVPTEQNTSKDFLLASDPWLDGWDYRKVITIIGSAGAGTDYQVALAVDEEPDMQFDFVDVRFTDSGGVNELDYFLEWYDEVDPGGAGDDNIGYFWVEVTYNLDTNQEIYMYYGNDAVSTTSDGEAAFIVYEDWLSESIDPAIWDIHTADGSISYSAVGATHGTIAKISANAGANTYKLTTDYDSSAPLAVVFRGQVDDADEGNTQRMGSGHSGAFAFTLIESDAVGNDFRVYDDDANEDSQPMDVGYFDAYWTFQITRDGTNAKLYADMNLIETASCDPDIVSTNSAFSWSSADSENDIYLDWMFVRKFMVGVEPAFDDFGEEENAPVPEWVAVGSATFIFPIGWDPTFQFGFDAFFIFAGLIMIPLSTMYLVRGGRKGLSTDKLFYALIIFVVGLGLFIGGIMP